MKRLPGIREDQIFGEKNNRYFDPKAHTNLKIKDTNEGTGKLE